MNVFLNIIDPIKVFYKKKGKKCAEITYENCLGLNDILNNSIPFFPKINKFIFMN